MLNCWLDPVSLYVRESEEDSALLILSGIGLSRELASAGLASEL